MKRTALASLLAAPLFALAACSSMPSEGDIKEDLMSDEGGGLSQEVADCAAPKIMEEFTDEELENWEKPENEVDAETSQQMLDKITPILKDCGAGAS